MAVFVPIAIGAVLSAAGLYVWDMEANEGDGTKAAMKKAAEYSSKTAGKASEIAISSVTSQIIRHPEQNKELLGRLDSAWEKGDYVGFVSEITSNLNQFHVGKVIGFFAAAIIAYKSTGEMGWGVKRFAAVAGSGAVGAGIGYLGQTLVLGSDPAPAIKSDTDSDLSREFKTVRDDKKLGDLVKRAEEEVPTVYKTAQQKIQTQLTEEQEPEPA